MNLTICLVTKGRDKYLDYTLRSFEPFLRDLNTRVLIIDNGSQEPAKGKLSAWSESNSEKVNLVRIEKNDPMPTSWWPIIIESELDWVVFPGDDDELCIDILEELKKALMDDPEMVAFASSLAVMREDGSLTGEILSPRGLSSNSAVEQIAIGLHGTPFAWPGLFFRVSKIDSKVPSSRYIFDWWIALNLIISGSTKVTRTVGANYRVYPGQESNLAPLRRIYFEGALWLADFVESDLFGNWIVNLDDNARINLWHATVKAKPIYGDLIFSWPLVFQISRLLIKSSRSSATASMLVSDFAILNGVFLKSEESRHLISSEGRIDNFISFPSNVSVSFNQSSCDIIKETQNYFTLHSLENHFVVACNHSGAQVGGVKIDCSSLDSNNASMNADLIIEAITLYCEEKGTFQRTISSSDMELILKIRALRKKLPNRLKILIRWIRKWSHRQG